MKLLLKIALPIFLSIPVFFSSCKVVKPTYYFRNMGRDTSITGVFEKNTDFKIKQGDELNIIVSSLSKEEDAVFNNYTSIGLATKEENSSTSFLVGLDGTVYLHKIGKIKAEGLTRLELKTTLEKNLQPYLKDPIVNVQFSNHKITIIGEVGKPQQLKMGNEKVSIIDLLAQSGNLTANAMVTDILIIREKESSTKEFKHINLEDHAVFNSPFYYLQPNDIVVVNPNEKKVEQELKRLKYQQVSAIFFQGLATALIIYQTFFRK